MSVMSAIRIPSRSLGRPGTVTVCSVTRGFAAEKTPYAVVSAASAATTGEATRAKRRRPTGSPPLRQPTTASRPAASQASAKPRNRYQHMAKKTAPTQTMGRIAAGEKAPPQASKPAKTAAPSRASTMALTISSQRCPQRGTRISRHHTKSRKAAKTATGMRINHDIAEHRRMPPRYAVNSLRLQHPLA